MSEKQKGCSCLYCGDLVEDGPEQAAQMAEHIWVCNKHPLGWLVALIDLLYNNAGNFLTPSQIMEKLKEEAESIREGFINAAKEGFRDGKNEEENQTE